MNTIFFFKVDAWLGGSFFVEVQVQKVLSSEKNVESKMLGNEFYKKLI